MAAPTLTEEAKLLNLGLLATYNANQQWFIRQAKVLLKNAQLAVQIASGTNTGAAHTFTQDEIGQMLNIWLMHEPQWLRLLRSKPHLSTNHYNLITDSMSRYIAWTDYIPIIT